MIAQSLRNPVAELGLCLSFQASNIESSLPEQCLSTSNSPVKYEGRDEEIGRRIDKQPLSRLRQSKTARCIASSPPRARLEASSDRLCNCRPRGSAFSTPSYEEYARSMLGILSTDEHGHRPAAAARGQGCDESPSQACRETKIQRGMRSCHPHQFPLPRSLIEEKCTRK